MAIIYHNPACGPSRKLLQALRDSGADPTIIEYLKTPPDAATLRRLLAAIGVPARKLIRAKEPIYLELALDDAALDDDALIAAMADHPILIERPIVVTARGTRLCRPPERLAELL